MRGIFLENRLKKKKSCKEQMNLQNQASANSSLEKLCKAEFEIKFNLDITTLITAFELKYFLKFLKFKQK